MNPYLKGGIARIASVAVGLAMLASVATPVGAVTIDELLLQIAALQAQLLTLQGDTSMSCNFTMNLKMGMSHAEVKDLQKFLNAHGAAVASTGAGSPGNETMYFGGLTKAAPCAFKNF